MRTEPTWERNRLAGRASRQRPELRRHRRLGTASWDQSLRKPNQSRRRDRSPSTSRNRRSLVQHTRVGSTKGCHTSEPSNPTSAWNNRARNTPTTSSVTSRTSDPSNSDPSSLVRRSSSGTSADAESRRSPRNPTNSSPPRPSARPLALQTSSSRGPSQSPRSNTHQCSVESRLLRAEALATAIRSGPREVVPRERRVCRS